MPTPKTHALNKANGTNAIGGALNIFSGGTVQLYNDNQIADNSAVTISAPSARERLSGRSADQRCRSRASPLRGNHSP